MIALSLRARLALDRISYVSSAWILEQKRGCSQSSFTLDKKQPLILHEWRVINVGVTYLLGLGFQTIGCYRDTGNRAITTLEGSDPILDGSYWTRTDPIAKCAVAAIKRGYTMFAVQHSGWCAASATASSNYNKYGRSSACRPDGEGGPWANQVYVIKGKCWITYIAVIAVLDNLEVSRMNIHQYTRMSELVRLCSI